VLWCTTYAAVMLLFLFEGGSIALLPKKLFISPKNAQKLCYCLVNVSIPPPQTQECGVKPDSADIPEILMPTALLLCVLVTEEHTSMVFATVSMSSLTKLVGVV